MLQAAGRRVGGRRCALDATKGSYTGPDSSSQATHAGGGAVDLSVRRRCGRSVKRVVRSLRRVGFAAWYRNWPGNRHIHAVAISDPDMANEIAFPGWFDVREQIVGFAQQQGRPERRHDREDDPPAPHMGAVQAVPVTSAAARIARAIRAAAYQQLKTDDRRSLKPKTARSCCWPAGT